MINFIKMVDEDKLKKEIQLNKFTQITDNIFLGDYWGAYEKAKLHEEGITKILVCGSDLKCFYPNEFEYKKIKVVDKEYEDIYQHFDDCYKFVYDNISDSKTFVHCQFGISRSATIVIACIMKSCGMSYESALELVKSKRPIVSPNKAFIEQLKKFQADLEIESTNHKNKDK